MGAKPKDQPPPPEIVQTKAPTMADNDIAEVYKSNKKRGAAASRLATILTSGMGDLSAVNADRKTLLGQ